MRISDTEQLQKEYAEIYNKYMMLPDDSKELNNLKELLRDYETKLATRFLMENGWDFEKSGEFYIYVKKRGV